MALSSCTFLASGTAQLKGNFFKEDAAAHSELFGNEGKEVALKAKQPNYSMTPGSGALLEPKIGVQYRADYTKDAVHYCAVRFVAAIASLEVNAEWTRAAYKANGDMTGTEDTVTVTKAYASLIDDGDPVSATSAGAGYNYFVVYTVYNIPVTTFNDYYIVAHLKISDPANPATVQYSKITAARIGGTIQASFPLETEPGYFLAGTFNGVENQALMEDDKPDDDDSVARFERALTKDDSFYICYKTATIFKLYDSSCLSKLNDPSDNPYFQSASGNKIKVLTTHNYAFNFDKTDKIKDLEIGYSVNYQKADDSYETVALTYNGYDGSSKPQHTANISPKTGTDLYFTYERAEIIPSREDDGNNNINNSLFVIIGGPDINIYLKDIGENSRSLWVNYPDLRVLVDGEPVSAAKRANPRGNVAVFEVPLTAGQNVIVCRGYNELKLGDTQNVEYTASATATYAFYINSQYKVYTDELATVTFRITKDAGANKSLYAVGSISGDWEPWEEYRLTWTEGNVWVGSFLLPIGRQVQVVVAPSSNPTKGAVNPWHGTNYDIEGDMNIEFTWN